MDQKANQKDDISLNRKFLHDIATPISIVRLLSKRLLRLWSERNGNEVEKELLEKIIAAVATMETLHANHKSQIREDKAS